MSTIAKKRKSGFTFVELLVTLIISSIVVAGLYNFINRQRKQVTSQKLKADIESMAQISFFIIGRDIRRAGSNPSGWGSYTAGMPINFDEATEDRLIIRADLNGNSVIEANTDEQITYEFVDDPDNPDGVKDQIRRQAGDQLVIQNVKNFAFCYYMAGAYWDCNPADETQIRKVRMTLVAGTGKLNPNTGQEDTKEIQMIIRPRNFDL